MNGQHDNIGPMITAVVVPLALGLLIRSAKRTGRREEGKCIVEYGLLPKAFAVAVCALDLALCITLFFVDAKDREPVGYLILMFGFFAVVSTLEVFPTRISYDSRQIRCQSGWRKSRTIEWDEVESFGYSGLRGAWILHTRGHGTISVNQFMSGMAEMINHLNRRGIRQR